MERGSNDESDKEDVIENVDEAVQSIIADEVDGRGMLWEMFTNGFQNLLAILETHLKTKNIAKVANSVFKDWSWMSNVVQSLTSCRIIVGWDAQAVKVMVIQAVKQSVLCLVKTSPDQIKFYLSIVYASNNENERMELWNCLEMKKRIAENHHWVVMGDFNVTLKPEEHSNRGSVCNTDMQEFIEFVNNLKVDDLCSSGFYFTWTKSLKNPNNSTLKKLDRILMNDNFINQYCRAHGVFLPCLVSDHSVGLLIFLDGLPKKVISFRFANYIADRNEFLDTVLKECLQVAQDEVDKDPFNVDKRRKAIVILEEYTKVFKDELKLLYQKARIN
ncbi:RNA-directed DNA polymerase, eukaryota, reverse transcriptase zinc-binding domain protein [Tanacetum coccineum]